MRLYGVDEILYACIQDVRVCSYAITHYTCTGRERERKKPQLQSYCVPLIEMNDAIALRPTETAGAILTPSYPYGSFTRIVVIVFSLWPLLLYVSVLIIIDHVSARDKREYHVMFNIQFRTPCVRASKYFHISFSANIKRG